MTYRFVTNKSLRIIQIILLLEAIVRGASLMMTPAHTNALFAPAEMSMSLTAWGLVFIALGLFGLVGELWMTSSKAGLGWDSHAWPSFIAHIGLMAVFAAFALSTLVGVAARTPVFGFITPFDFLVFAFAHWAFARRRKHA